MRTSRVNQLLLTDFTYFVASRNQVELQNKTIHKMKSDNMKSNFLNSEIEIKFLKNYLNDKLNSINLIREELRGSNRSAIDITELGRYIFLAVYKNKLKKLKSRSRSMVVWMIVCE